MPNGIMPADKVVIRRRVHNWVISGSLRIVALRRVPRRGGVSAPMDKKCKTSMVNSRLRQQANAVPRRILCPLWR
ncbi:hypothetical protein MPL3365_320049 [Mesorhizobium plurifarium]|uniref:Uncharacterized protein n=1 Tax=Mesorhizobium plurifarium TaxID=69974 RepID=A0A090GVI6_MESPL|nr:hypothetical protein MPL3365_320049 [Mesorhizobium plurifarium]